VKEIPRQLEISELRVYKW